MSMMIRLLFIFFITTVINVSAVSVDKYRLQLEVSSQKVYLGDKLNIKLIFQYSNLEDYEMQEIKIPNFNVEELNSSDYKDESGIFIEEIHYRLTPLKGGIFNIGNFKVNIETLTKNYKNFDNKSKYTKKFSIYSNSIKIFIKELPKNVSAIGKYTLSANVDKLKLRAGEVATLSISLKGVGNITNLNSVKLHIPNATSYLIMSSKSNKKHLYTKTFEILSDTSYTIPAFTLEYFDKELGVKMLTQSNEFHINIINSKKVKLQSKKFTKDRDKLLFFLIGIFSTLFCILIYTFYKSKVKKRDEPSFIKSLQKLKKQNTFYKKIVVYLGRDKELNKLIYMLENENTSKFKSIKKSVIERIKKMEIESH